MCQVEYAFAMLECARIQDGRKTSEGFRTSQVLLGDLDLHTKLFFPRLNYCRAVSCDSSTISPKSALQHTHKVS
jgi:hypothetical protein